MGSEGYKKWELYLEINRRNLPISELMITSNLVKTPLGFGKVCCQCDFSLKTTKFILFAPYSPLIISLNNAKRLHREPMMSSSTVNLLFVPFLNFCTRIKVF